MPTIALSTVPGFADLPDATLSANRFSLGVHLQRIYANASFGLVRLEVFNGIYKHGDTVALPTSLVDGYTYSPSELIYMWVPQNTANQATGWASFREPWTMWYGIWNVDQTSGLVSSEIGYRGNNDHKDNQATTNDGVVQVFTIAQRQKTGLTLSAAPTFTKHLDTDFFTDRALNTGLLVDMNRASKFATVNTEIMYMGEFFNGQTVPQPVSPIDGRVYAYAECLFQTSWRWTADTDGSNNPIKPAINKGQLQDWSASVTPSGGIRISNTAVNYELNGQHTGTTGKVAVFAFCTRPAGTTFASVQTSFAELPDSIFASGSTCRASNVQQINKNINQAICTPEFFGPTNYSNGNNIALPTSPLDGYTYARSELTYIWDWANTGPAANATGRLSLVHGSIDGSGNVTVSDYRLNSGASAAALVHEGTMRVIVVGKRSTTTSQSFHPISPPDISGDAVPEWFGYIPGVLSDNLILNGDFTDGANDWDLTQSSGTGQFLSGITGLPRGSAEFKSDAVASVRIQKRTAVPIDINKTYFIECWVKVPASGSVVLGGLQEYDQSGAAITRSGALMYCLNNGVIPSPTAGSTWQYFAAEIVGNSATPTNNQFLTAARSVRPMFLINWSGSSSNLNVEIDGFRLSEVAAGHVRAIKLLQLGISTDLNKQGSIAPGQTITMSITYNDTSIQISWTSQSVLRSDQTVLTTNTIGSPYSSTGLTASTKYYMYPFIDARSGTIGFANSLPPTTSPSTTAAIGSAFDGRIQLPPIVIQTLTAGGTGGSGTGGGGGSCPEENELVDIEGLGQVRAEEVKAGQFIKGYSFALKQDIYRKIIQASYQSCSAWRMVDGYRVTPCEPIYKNDRWMPAFRALGSIFDDLVGYRIDIVVEADEFDEHNYWLVGRKENLLIHNSFILPS